MHRAFQYCSDASAMWSTFWRYSSCTVDGGMSRRSLFHALSGNIWVIRGSCSTAFDWIGVWVIRKCASDDSRSRMALQTGVLGEVVDDEAEWSSGCSPSSSMVVTKVCVPSAFIVKLLTRFATIHTGVGGMRGKVVDRFHCVLRLGAIISSVTTFGLNGQTPVFRNAAAIRSGFRACWCARPYTRRKFSLDIISPVSHS